MVQKKLKVVNLEGKNVGYCPHPKFTFSQMRPDIVEFVFKNMNKNKRQPYAVNSRAGHRPSAQSWGTGRAMSRVPRVSVSGSHRSGQGAVANICRGGHMFAPTKVWRKWHVKINKNLKRISVLTAVISSFVPGLVMARGHKVEDVEQFPLIVSDELESVSKTKDAMQILKNLSALEDVERAKDSRKIRTGIGKIRNRRHVNRLGPLVIYKEDKGVSKAFRNIPGVDIISVEAMNLLKLAPGGHIGRFIIWTKGAFEYMSAMYDSENPAEQTPKGFKVPNPIIGFSDLIGFIESDTVSSLVKDAANNPSETKRPFTQRKNPLRNRSVMVRLNPLARSLIRKEILTQEKVENGEKLEKKKAVFKHRKMPFTTTLLSAMD